MITNIFVTSSTDHVNNLILKVLYAMTLTYCIRRSLLRTNGEKKTSASSVRVGMR